MSKAAAGAGLLVLAAAGTYLLASGHGQESGSTPSSAPPGPAPPPSPIEDAQDDETALARMLRSESDSRQVRIVIGWIEIERARRAHRSIFEQITSGQGYGHQDGPGEHRHAGTSKAPTPETRELARALLDGKIVPSLAIRRHFPPGGWVQRGQRRVSDEDILALQDRWKEGIFARIQGTSWVLFNRDTPRISVSPYLSARERLDNLPQVPALDEVVA